MVLVNLMSTVVVTVVPVHVYKELNIIQSAGVEFRGLKTSAISWRKPLSKPVLEKYVLTPNVEPAHLDLHTALRVCTHITLENKPVTLVKVVELHTQGSTPLAPAVDLILADKPLSKASITMWNGASLELQLSGIHSIFHCPYRDFQGMETTIKGTFEVLGSVLLELDQYVLIHIFSITITELDFYCSEYYRET
jgi:hypothetical protein